MGFVCVCGGYGRLGSHVHGRVVLPRHLEREDFQSLGHVSRRFSSDTLRWRNMC